MLFYSSAETLKSKLEPSRPVPSATSLAPETIVGSAQESDAAGDNHSQVDSLPTQPADHQNPDTSAKLPLWGLAGAFPFLVAFLIWMAGITRSYNMALEVCFGLTVGILLLLLLSYAVPLLSGNEKYMIKNWVLIVIVAAFGVVWALSYWLDISILPGRTKTEPPSIDLFMMGVFGFNHLKERRARSTRQQAGSLIAEGT